MEVANPAGDDGLKWSRPVFLANRLNGVVNNIVQPFKSRKSGVMRHYKATRRQASGLFVAGL